MNGKKIARVIATWVVTFVMVSVFLLDIMTLVLCNKYEKNYDIKTETFTIENGDDRIHFLNTGNSDCILLESNGRFALIDSGEGNNNPRKKTAYRGYRDDVIDYLKKVASDENGTIHLEFILGTHIHYDHVGNFEDIINCDDIVIGRAYFKKFDTAVGTDLESEDWGNAETYSKIITALENKNITLIQNIPDWEFSFGDFRLQFLNGITPDEVKGNGENASSIGVIVTKGTKKAFLAADFTKDTGLEQIYADDIGDVDLLKIGHHGYYGSSSPAFLKKLKPEIAIVTNPLGKIYPNVKWNLTVVAKAAIYSPVNRNGIVATFTDDNKIVLTQHSMD